MIERPQKDIDIIAFLSEILQANTQNYQSDFQYDIDTLQAAAAASDAENRSWLWMSRPSGTWCFKEREVFLQNTAANQNWQFYDYAADKIKAYRVEVCGRQGDRVFGNVYPLDYREHLERVKKLSIPAVRAVFLLEDGTEMTLTFNNFVADYRRMVSEHGVPLNSHYAPASEMRLAEILRQEHKAELLSKRGRVKKTHKASRSNIVR